MWGWRCGDAGRWGRGCVIGCGAGLDWGRGRLGLWRVVEAVELRSWGCALCVVGIWGYALGGVFGGARCGARDWQMLRGKAHYRYRID